MNTRTLHALGLATLTSAVLITTDTATTQSDSPTTAEAKATATATAKRGSDDKPIFAAPIRLKSGESFVGAGRLYPSPVLRDLNGDQLPDILVGDLFGRLTFAPRDASAKSAIRFSKEVPMENDQGKKLKFHNW